MACLLLIAGFANSQTADLLEKAQRGDAAARFRLGAMHEDGQGAAQSDREPAQWYRRVADHGLPAAQAAGASMHPVGQGFAISEREALKWWRRAANQGHAPAQFTLGTKFEPRLEVMQPSISRETWARPMQASDCREHTITLLRDKQNNTAVAVMQEARQRKSLRVFLL